MFRVSAITKGAIRAVAVVAIGVGSLIPFALSATSASASPKASFPVHPATYNPKLHVVKATQEQNCQYPTGLIGGKWYCGGYVPNLALTFSAKLVVVTATQEQDCQYPTGLIKGNWYCGGYVSSKSHR